MSTDDGKRLTAEYARELEQLRDDRRRLHAHLSNLVGLARCRGPLHEYKSALDDATALLIEVRP